MQTRIAFKKNWQRVCLMMALCLCALGSCESPNPAIKAALEPRRIFVKQEFELKSDFFRNNVPVDAPAEIEYRAKLGKVAEGIYYAPENPGEEYITIYSGNTEASVHFDVLPAPRLILSPERNTVNCEEAVVVTPVVEVGNEKEDIAVDRFAYKAQRGTFQSNIYHAPLREGSDTIEISYPPLGLTATRTLEITNDAVLEAQIAPVIPCNGKTAISFYLKNKDKTVPVLPQDVEVRPQQGRWEGGNYVAPAHACRDKIGVEHKHTGQQIALEIEVEPWEVQFTLPEGKLSCGETIALEPHAYRAGREVAASVKDFRFTAMRGKFHGNVYEAPSSEGKDTITIEYVPSVVRGSRQITIEYSPYRLMHTDRFVIPIPTGWQIEETGIGFAAKGKGSYSNCGIGATVLPGFDFLDIETMKLLFQQQIDTANQNVEETSEDEIFLGGAQGLKITFENYSGGLSEKSWWIFLKREGASYVIVIQGSREFFEAGIPQYIVENFQFKTLKMSPTQSFAIPEKIKVVKEDSFAISVPEDWQIHNLSGGFLSKVSDSDTNEVLVAISEVHENGRALILFILAHRQPEVRNLDLALLVVLLRQMIKDTEITQEKEVRDFSLEYGEAKLLEIQGGADVAQKTWLIATKYESTAYGILIRGPVKIWEANPQLPEKILRSFVPRQ